jgi:hypothetical protein
LLRATCSGVINHAFVVVALAISLRIIHVIKAIVIQLKQFSTNANIMKYLLHQIIMITILIINIVVINSITSGFNQAAALFAGHILRRHNAFVFISQSLLKFLCFLLS